MKITCLNCGAQYLVNDAQIKPDGTKVRCSECSWIFMAYPPVAPGTAALSAEILELPEAKTDFSEAPGIRFTGADTAGVKNEFETDIRSDMDSFSAGVSGEPSYLRIDDDIERQEELDESFRLDKEVSDDGFFAPKEESFSDDTWATSSEFMEAMQAKKSSGGNGWRVLGHVLLTAVLIVLVTVACLLVAMRFFHVQLPPWAQKVVELPVLRDLAQIQPHTGPTVALVKGSGHVDRLRNADGERLLILTGELQNISKTPQGFLTADVQLYQKGTPVLIAAQSFYAGNEMTLDDIKTTPFTEVQELMQQPFGHNRKNAKVLPNEKIKFMGIMKAPEVSVDIVVQAGAAKPIPE